MATLYTVLAAIQAQVSAATQGLISNSPDTAGKPLNVQVGLYWPSAKALQNNVRPANPPGAAGPTALVTIYDRGLASDSTRWLPQVVSTTTTQPTMTVTVSPPGPIPPLGSVTVTFGGTVAVGDAVGIVLAPSLGNSEAVVPIGVAGDTPTTMAAKLASMLALGDPIPPWAISPDSNLPLWVSAVASGPVVTVTSLLPTQSLAIIANVGNNGSQMIEIARRKRHFQIVCWCRTLDDRITVTDPIETMIAQLEYNFGLTFPDGTLGRVTFTGDKLIDDATLSDTLRRDFMMCVEYGITVSDITYSVLAPIIQTTTF